MKGLSTATTSPPFLRFTLFVFTFILFTIIGTLSHEFGHIFFAQLLGYQWELHFASMNTIDAKESELHAFLITAGGTLQTILTGTIGYILLLKSRKVSSHFSTIDYLWFFLSLFWLRQVFNLLHRFALGVFSGSGIYFGGDETGLSQYLGLHQGFWSLLLGGIGVIICAHVFFFLTEKKERILLITSGIFGSALGFWIWMIELGPLLIP